MSNALVLMPLETLAQTPLFKQHDGSRGENREVTKRCLIPAKNDLQAIEAWLAEYQKSAATQRSYRKEAERLLLWALVECHKPLSSLMAEDLLHYSQFLEDPQPAERWCGPKAARKGQRWSAQWRPFVGGLSPTAKEGALRNLASLFNYLADNAYLSHNPMRPIKRQLLVAREDRQALRRRVAERVIDLDEWFAIQEALEALPDNTSETRWEKVRLRFLIALGYFGALRNHEIETHTMGCFHKVRDWQTGQDRWWMRINGKGDKVRDVPVNADLLAALFDYRLFLNLPREPQPGETEPLLKSRQTDKGLTGRRINQLIKQLTAKAAERFSETHPEKAARLKRFSAHWLRHLSCSMQGLVNIDRQNIKANAGHENMATTDIYLHASDILRHEQMNKLCWRPALRDNSREPVI